MITKILGVFLTVAIFRVVNKLYDYILGITNYNYGYDF